MVPGWRNRAVGALTGVPNLLPNHIQGAFADRPVLFIDGGLDTDCPAAVNAETVRLINALNGQAEHFVDLNSGHGFSPLMRTKFVDWLVTHGRPPLMAG